MSHRPGHIDDTGSGTQSMDRRKYLKTLTLGAVASAAVSVLDSCTAKDTTSQMKSPDQSAGAAPATVPLWGYLSVFPHDVIKIDDAKNKPLKEGDELFRIPFYNNNQIDIKQGSIVGFTLLKIGCAPEFVIATNLVEHDHAEDEPVDWYIKRNLAMDETFRSVGLQPKPWSLPAPC